MEDSKSDLTPEQMQYARVMFQNRVLQSSGQRFEDFFVAIMTRRDHRFRAIKPQGRIGDQGNDGFIPEIGRYFQVFSPEDPSGKAETAADKAREDFEKLWRHWNSTSRIVDYRFVFNDKYRGVYPTLEHVLAELKRTYNLEVVKPFLAKDLEYEFLQLSTADKQAALEMVIPRPQYIEDLDFGAFQCILQHIVENQQPLTDGRVAIVPDYDEKIQFNGINLAASLLRVGNYQNSAVDLFFDRHGEFTRADIRNRLARCYQSAMATDCSPTSSDEGVGDRVFFRLLSDLAPGATKQVQDAAIVLIAYYFEKCDVFQEPNV